MIADKIMNPQVFRKEQVIDSGLFWCEGFKFLSGRLCRTEGIEEDVDEVEGDPRYDNRCFD